MMLDTKNYNLRKIPNTESKENIIEASMSSYELFVRECWEQIENVSGPDLFEMYNRFIERNKFAACSSRTFITNMKAFTGETRVKRIHGKNVKVYSLLPEVREKYKRMNEELEKLIVDDPIDDDAF